MKCTTIVFIFLFIFVLCDIHFDDSTRNQELDYFRNLLFSYSINLNELAEYGYRPKDMHELITYVPDDLLEALDYDDFDMITNAFSKRIPSDLYNEGLKHDFKYIRNVDKPFYRTKEPITIILFPGLMGEFLPISPLEDFVEDAQNSRFSKIFSKKWEEAPPSLQSVKHYSLKTFGYISSSLTDVFKVASYDDYKGRTLVQFILYQPPPGGFETLGKSEDNYDAIMPHLDHLFRILDEDIGRFYFAGYSRAPIPILHMFNTAPKDIRYPWFNRVRGLISLGGTIWGSASMGDCFFGYINPLPSHCVFYHDLYLTIKELIDKLESSYTAFVRNTYHIGKALTRIAFSLSQKPKIPELDKMKVKFPNLIKTYEDSLIDIIDQLNLEKPISDYPNIIRRFKISMEAIFDSMKEFSWKERIKWFTKNTIPTNLNYFTISDTLPNSAWSNFTDCKNCRPGTIHPDTYLSRAHYYLVEQVEKTQINDGFHTVQCENMLPNLHMRLNPYQAPYKGHLLGIVWGGHTHLIEHLVKTYDGWKNRFPRKSELLAISNFVQEVENKKRDEYYITSDQE